MNRTIVPQNATPQIVNPASAPGKRRSRPWAGRGFGLSMGLSMGMSMGLLVVLGSARADGMSDWREARELCLKQLEAKGKADDTQALYECCDQVILVANYKENKKLVAQCSSSKPAGSK